MSRPKLEAHTMMCTDILVTSYLQDIRELGIHNFNRILCVNRETDA